MKAALISLGSVSSNLTIDAMKKYFDSVDPIKLKDIEINLGTKEKVVYVSGKPLAHYDCIYTKGSFRYNPILRAITSALRNESYMPILASAYTTGHDKFLTQLKLQAEGIPMPKTYLSSSVEAAKNLIEKLTYPIILKLPQGTQGKGVLFADSYAVAASILDTLVTLKQPFIVQEYIETSSTDIRALVVGSKVVAAMKRRAVHGEKRANIHAGGKGEPVILDTKTKKIAVKAAQSLGVGIAAVDILESVKGPLVIEINLSPGIQGLMDATKIDIPDIIAKFLYEKTKVMVEGKKKSSASKIFSDISSERNKKEIISSLDMRGERILLPEVVTKISHFSDKGEYLISVDKDEIRIKESY